MVEEHIKSLFPDSVQGYAYIGELPSTPEDVIAILLYQGAGNAEYFSFSTIYEPVIKIVLRNSSYDQARRWVEEIKGALHKHTDDYFTSIIMRGYPMYLGKDAQKLHEFQIVFNIQVKE